MIPAEAAGKLRRLTCWLRGHKWVERKPHRAWDVNTVDCLRCGATKKVGFDGGDLENE